jgi:hypothetical protein
LKTANRPVFRADLSAIDNKELIPGFFICRNKAHKKLQKRCYFLWLGLSNRTEGSIAVLERRLLKNAASQGWKPQNTWVYRAFEQ